MTPENIEKLKSVIGEVSRHCVFWACPGPDAPIEDMKTCQICWSTHMLREILKSEEEADKPAWEEVKHPNSSYSLKLTR